MTLLLLFMLGATSGPAGRTPPLQAGDPPAQVDSVAEAYLQFLVGRRLEADGDIEGAAAAYRKAAELDPQGAEIRAELAGLYARQDRAREALEWANAALAIDGTNREANRIIGLVYAAFADQPAAAQALGLAGGPEELARRTIGHLQRADALQLVDPALHHALGRMYLRTRDYAKAAEALRRLQDEQPGVSDASLLLADALVGEGRPGEARRTLEQALAEQPGFARARVRLAELYEQAGRWAEAAGQYGLASESNPRNGELVRRRATAYLRAAQPASAREAIRELTAGDQAAPSDLYLLFQAERDLGDLAAAEATARRIIAAEPDGIRGVYALSQVFDQRRDHAAAVALLEPAIARGRQGRASPEQIVILVTQLGFAYQGLGRHDRAIDTFAQLRALAPADPSGPVYLVQAHLVAHRNDEAVALAEQARHEFPREPRLVELLAEGYRRQGHPARGIALIEGALETRATPSLFVTLSELYAADNRVQAAVDLLADARATFPDDPAVPFQLAAVLEQAGRDLEAERVFRELLALDPLNAPALNYLGYMLADRGRSLDEAVSLIQRALARDPQNAAYLDSLGWAYFKLGELELAERNLRLAAGQLTTSSVVQDHLGDVLYRLERVDEAIAAWQRALEGDGEEIERAAIEAKIRAARERNPHP